ncbi:MAG: hypothetical protein MI824_01330, partial [Hyphomicrobiales bacterium]|nr:hypothetical protein [Hyphomicrobiales bacterium]
MFAFEPDGGRIVFEALAAMALSGELVVLVIDGLEVPSDEFVELVLAAQDGLELEPEAGDETAGEDESEGEDEIADEPQGDGGDSGVELGQVLATFAAQGGIAYRERQLAQAEEEDPLQGFNLQTQEVSAPPGTPALEVADPVSFEGEPAEDQPREFFLSAATRPSTDSDLIVIQVELELPFQVVDSATASLARAASDSAGVWTIDLAALEAALKVPADTKTPDGLVTEWTFKFNKDTGKTTLTIDLNQNPAVGDPSLTFDPDKAGLVDRNFFSLGLPLTPPPNAGGDIQDGIVRSVSRNIRAPEIDLENLDHVPFENLGVALAFAPADSEREPVRDIQLLVERGATLNFEPPKPSGIVVNAKTVGRDQTFYTIEFDPPLAHDDAVALIDSFRLESARDGDKVNFEISTKGIRVAGGAEVFDIIVDDVVDGSEVLLDEEIIRGDEVVVGSLTGSTPLKLSLDQEQDSTSIKKAADGTGSIDTDHPFVQGGGDTDGSETVTEVKVTLEVAEGAPLPALAFEIPDTTAITVDARDGVPSGNAIAWTFSVAEGTRGDVVSDLMKSFVLARDNPPSFDTVSVTIETTTEETNADVTLADQGNGSVSEQTGGLELTSQGSENLANNRDIDSYSFIVQFDVDTPQPEGRLLVNGRPDGFFPGDSETPVVVSAKTAASKPDAVITEIVVSGLPTAADDWTVDPSPLAAAVAALDGQIVINPAGDTITITFQEDDRITDIEAQAAALDAALSPSIDMTPPANSDVDFPGVRVSVTAIDRVTKAADTRDRDAPLVVDAVVDGSELLQNAAVIGAGATIAGDPNAATALNLSLTLTQDSTSETGTTNPDPDQGATQGGGDADASEAGPTNDGSEAVTQIVVTLSVAEGE